VCKSVLLYTQMYILIYGLKYSMFLYIYMVIWGLKDLVKNQNNFIIAACLIFVHCNVDQKDFLIWGNVQWKTIVKMNDNCHFIVNYSQSLLNTLSICLQLVYMIINNLGLKDDDDLVNILLNYPQNCWRIRLSAKTQTIDETLTSMF
jgi:hypothetical protein